MRTSGLIRALAADAHSRTMRPGRALTLASIPSVAAAFGLVLAMLGLRPHLISLLGDPRIAFKLGLTILLAGLSARMVLLLASPAANVRGVGRSLAIIPALLAAAVFAELIAVPEDLWVRRAIGSNAAFCLISIPFLAAVPLAATLLAMRQGAPENPSLAGAAAGLFAGAIGAAFYATHCTDDSPLFVAVWYSLAIGFVVAAGALAGRRILRW